jgi:hypothetical protein
MKDGNPLPLLFIMILLMTIGVLAIITIIVGEIYKWIIA